MAVRTRRRRRSSAGSNAGINRAEESTPSPSRKQPRSHRQSNNHRLRSFLYLLRLTWQSVTIRRRTYFLVGLLLGILIVYQTAAFETHHGRRFLLLQQQLRSTVTQRIRDFVPADFVPAFTNDLLSNITSFIVDSLPSAENSAPALLLLQSKNVSAHFPVVIIPGIVSTNLESWARGGCAESYFRKKIWGDLSMGTNLLLDKECWLKNLQLDFVTGLDADGTKIRAMQGIDAADYFVPGYWVWAKIIENLAIIGYDNNNLHVASYDWRLSTPNLEKRDHYFTKLKAHLEVSRKITGRKAVLISHSMGGNVVHYFLKWVESRYNGFHEGWVNDHIHAVIGIATPALGVPKSIAALLSGEMRDTAQLGWFMSTILEQVLTRKERTNLFRSWGGSASLLPKGGEAIWGNTTWAPDHPSTFPVNSNRSFGMFIDFQISELNRFLGVNGYIPPDVTADHYLNLLFNNTDLHFKNRLMTDFSHGVSLEKLTKKRYDNPKYWTNPLESALPHAPDMTLYNFYGVGKSTERSYFYSIKEDIQTTVVDQQLNPNGTTEVKIDRLLGMHIDTNVEDPSSGLNSGVQDSDGDGTVPLISLGFMAVRGWRWPESEWTPDESTEETDLASKLSTNNGYGQIFNPGRVKIVAREFQHRPASLVKDVRGGPGTADHVDILGNHDLTMDILKIVSNDAADVTDRIHSNILEYADKVDLQEKTLD